MQRNGSGNPQTDIDFILSNKTELVIWIVSDCDITKAAEVRQILVKKLLTAGLQIARRGRCFNNYVANLNIIKKYKFYLSFENGYHCKDYITEKLFRNSYSMGAVPIVWGANKSDYEALAPPNSYIYVEDFNTLDDLVKYVNYLDKNDTAYSEYFKWRTKDVTDMPQYGRRIAECQLCRIIHGINFDNFYHPHYDELKSYIPTFGFPNRSRVVHSIGKWYYGQENPECFQQKSKNFNNFIFKNRDKHKRTAEQKTFFYT